MKIKTTDIDGLNAAAVANTPAGGIAATDVQAAINELDTEKQPLSSNLTAYAGGDTPSAFTLGIVDSVDAAAWRSAIGAGTSTVTPAALTKTDDTNVTLTLGGTPSTALLQATSVTVGWSGTLAVARGGTGSGTAAGARTNLGLDAGGAGDIWVEKAGDTMSGALNYPGGNITGLITCQFDGIDGRIPMYVFSGGASSALPGFISYGCRGTLASPTATGSGDQIFTFSARGYGATGFSTGTRASFSSFAGENWTDSAQGTFMVFGTTPNGSTTHAGRVRINSTEIRPETNDGLSLGATSNRWSDLYLASGGIVNWNNAVLLTHGGGTLSMEGSFQMRALSSASPINTQGRLVLSTSGAGLLNIFEMQAFGQNNANAFLMRSGTGTAGAPTYPTNNWSLGQFGGQGWDESTVNWSGQRASVNMIANEAWSGTVQGTRIDFLTATNGGTTTATKMSLQGTDLRPGTNDGTALGTGSVSWSDLFLASGGVINWANNNANITHSTGLLTSSVQVNVPVLGRGAPVTKTGNFTVAATESWLINNKSGSTCVVTLPTASSFTGREIMIKNIQSQLVDSATSNVVPLAGGAAGTAILPATPGAWATLVSDGTNWIIMQS